MKWRLALRIATSPSERWLMKAAEWNPELSSKYRTNRAIGRPRKRWEDDINGFLKQVEDRKQQPNQQNMDQQRKRPRKMNFTRRKYTNTSEERQENNARLRMRRNNQSRPARYVNRVRLSDEEVANITQHKSLKKTRVKSEMKILKDAAAPQSVPHASPKSSFLESSSSSAIKNFVMGDIQEDRDGLTSKSM